MFESSQFERFRISCFDDSFGASRDGLDAEAALSLSPRERAKAEALILSSLRHTNDSRPFDAARVMLIAAASPILKARLLAGFPPGYDYLRVDAARALYQLEKWEEAVTIILDVLHNTPKTRDHQWTRMKAVEALGDFGEDFRVHAELFAAVEDSDNFIGFLAIGSLEKIFSQSPAIGVLLATLRKTQIRPNRWKPEYLQMRQQTFLELESETGIAMPAVAMDDSQEM